MKKCLYCTNLFPSSESTCHTCGLQSLVLDGFPAYAPDFAYENAGFHSSYFTQLAKVETENFWFRARNRLIIWALGQYNPKFHSFLEIGCGTGFVLSGIAEAYPYTHLLGSEIFTAGLKYAADRLPGTNLMQMDARNIPFEAEFDCIGVFDVLEHIEEDTQVLTQMYQALKPAGYCLITVPQHPWLWSPSDDYACHVRRYRAKDLHKKIKDSGFEIVRSTSFVTSLLPAMLLSRMSQKIKGKKLSNPSSELEISYGLNFVFEKMLNAEIALIKGGVNFPLGGSRFVVAKKLEK